MITYSLRNGLIDSSFSGEEKKHLRGFAVWLTIRWCP